MGEYLSPADQGLRAVAQGELRARLGEGPIAIDEWFARLTILYYDHHVIGADFPTPPELFPEIGRSVALLALEAFQKMGEPSEFVVYEAGGGNGTFMREFLKESVLHPIFFRALAYHEIEQSSNLITRQSEALLAYPELREKVFWHRADVCSIDFPRTYAGMYIAIENDDDLPSKVVYKRNGLPSELFIVLEDGKVTQRELPASAELVQFLLDHREWWDAVPDGLQIPLPVHVESVRLRERLVRAFEKLVLFTIDYGYELTREAMHMPNWIFFQCKTFMGGQKKFFIEDDYARMYNYAGIANHTSNVDFSLLALPGERAGFETVVVNHRDFLAQHGLMRFVKEQIDELIDGNRAPEATLYAHRVAQIIDRGTNDWKVLIQWRGLDGDITAGRNSKHLVSWFYRLARKYELGDLTPANRRGSMK